MGGLVFWRLCTYPCEVGELCFCEPWLRNGEDWVRLEGCFGKGTGGLGSSGQGIEGRTSGQVRWEGASVLESGRRATGTVREKGSREVGVDNQER